MTMTLRLPEELDKQLEEIARAKNIPKHAVVVEAVARFVQAESKSNRVLRQIEEVMDQYADAIQRLEDA